MPKNRSNYQVFNEKASLELIQGWIWSEMISYPSDYSSGSSLPAFLSTHDSSLFRKSERKFTNFDDYVIVDYVIGHDVIGHPDVRTDNAGLILFSIENRLIVAGLQ